ncbi:ABC transporter substrate-binding protein [Nocardioides marmoriginsengisoli]|uniref:ABC transporter substrate-binding protein n=1 Tax=Nocardioides marmoriginsengisoli TaxID=661483 RepID=UPI0011CDBEA0|nr:ABC transporter substrate-binding protein [Nocardioides marmoriginsengisoli]
MLALAIPAACGGSQRTPEEVKAANDKLNGSINGGNSNGNGVDPVTGDPVDPGTDPGTNDPGTTDPGGTGNTPGGTGNTPGGTGNPGGGGNQPIAPGVKAGSCDGFKNGQGISDSTIKIGNSSDISGPVPGLFEAAQQATKAYVKYFNTTQPNGICGRKLELTNLDSRTDAGADQASYQKLCESVFAAVGSMSAFDSGGAQTAENCGLPDMRTAVVTATRNSCKTCFGAQPTGPYEFSNAVPDFIVKNYKAASQKAAFLYLNAGAAAENAKAQQKVEEKRGMKFLYTQGIDVATASYAPYVQKMKSLGVEYVQFIGAYQQSVTLAKAIQAGGFKPQVRLYDPSVYDVNFLKTGGSAVEGVFMFINFTPLEESQPELNLYKQWLQQVAPGANPTFFGEFAWSAAKLFVQNSIALGGKLNRSTLAKSFTSVHKWTGGGMHGPMDVGGKHSPSCVRFLQVKGGKFVPLGSTKYMCNGSSVGR